MKTLHIVLCATCLLTLAGCSEDQSQREMLFLNTGAVLAKVNAGYTFLVAEEPEPYKSTSLCRQVVIEQQTGKLLAALIACDSSYEVGEQVTLVEITHKSSPTDFTDFFISVQKKQ